MRKRKLFMAFLCLSLIAFGCRFIYGRTSTEITNRFKTGLVDIALTEYQKDGDGNETLWSDESLSYVMAGDVISRIPRIRVYGNECYVRARVVLCSEEGIEILSENVKIHGMEDTWIQAEDGYFYYREPLAYGDEVDVFQAVSISENFPKTMQGRSFSMDVDIDAIQSDNFLPDFNAENPWGNVEIIELQNGADSRISYFKKDAAFEILYQGEAGNLTANSDDFFINISSLMPGDIYSDTISLCNNKNKDIRIYFRNMSEDDSNLSENINLKITSIMDDREEVVYDGKMDSDELREYVILAVMPEKSDAAIEFEIHVPNELGNTFAGRSSSVKWIVSTEPIGDESSSDDIPEVNEEEDRDKIPEVNEEEDRDKIPEVNEDINSDSAKDDIDSTAAGSNSTDEENSSNKNYKEIISAVRCIGIMISVLSIFWFFFIIWKRRKKKEEEENDDIQK